MSVKLKDALFESNFDEIHNIFEAEKSKSIEIEGNVQTLSKATLEVVSKAIAAKINSQLPDLESIDAKTLNNPLGIVSLITLKKLSTISIKGLKVNPAQIKGEQQKGLTQFDFSKYEKLQIIPLFLNNKEMENLGGEKGDKEYAAIFYIPAIFTPIKKENLKLHKELFDIPDPPEGKAHMNVGVNKLHYEMLEPDEIEGVQKSFMTGNTAIIQRLDKLQVSRRPTGSNEKIGSSSEEETEEKSEEQADQTDSSSEEKSDEKKIEDSYNRINHSKLHENSLSSLLLNEYFGWGKDEEEEVKSQWASDMKKGTDTNYTHINLDDDDEDTVETSLDNLKVFDFLDQEKCVQAFKAEKKTKRIDVNKQLNDYMSGGGVMGDHLKKVKSWRLIIDLVHVGTQNLDRNKYHSEADLSTSAKYNVTDYKLIYSNICDGDGSINIKKLYKFLPNIRWETTTRLLIKGDSLSANNHIDTLEVKNITYNFKSNKIQFQTSSGSIIKDMPKDDAFHIEINGVKIEWNLPHLGPLRKTMSTFINTAKLFNSETSNDSVDVRRVKAANLFDVMMARLIDNPYDSDRVIDHYKSSTETVGFASDVPLGSLALSNTPIENFTLDIAEEDEKESDAVEDDEDANNLKHALLLLKQHRATSRKAWRNIKHDKSGDDEVAQLSSSDNSCDDVVSSLVTKNDTALINLTGDLKLSGTSKTITKPYASFESDITRVIDDIKHDFEGGEGSIEKAEEVFKYYGEGDELSEKIFAIIASAIKGDAEHVPMSGDHVEKVENIKTKKDLKGALYNAIDTQFKVVNPILNKELNHKSPEFEYGNKVLKQITDALDSNKSISINLDKFLENQTAAENLSSLINVNKILTKMKKDKADLDVLLENLDDESYEEHVKSVLIKLVSKALQGVLGANSSLLDHHEIKNKNLLREVTLDSALSLGLTATSIALVALGGGGVVSTAVIGVGIAFTLWRELSVKVRQAQEKYPKDKDMFSEAVLKNVKPIIVAAAKSVIANTYITTLFMLEDKLKAAGITLTKNSEALTNMYSSFKKSSDNQNKKQNLNPVGKKVYAEIIDAAYSFVDKSPFGKFIPQSSIENMLISSIFGDPDNPRNKFAKLINHLQKESYAYKQGLSFLLTEADGDTVESFEINKLRTQLAEIITKEFGTENFKSDITSALNVEIKKYEKSANIKLALLKKPKAKAQAIKFLHKVLSNVLGFSKKHTNKFLEKNDFLFETAVQNLDSVEIMLESQRLKGLLTEVDTLLAGVKAGSNVYLKYKSDASGNPIRAMKATLDKKGNIDVSSAEIVNVSEIPTKGITSIAQNDATNYANDLKSTYGADGSVTGGYEYGGFNVGKVDPNYGPTPPAAAAPHENQPLPKGSGTVESGFYTIDTINYILLAMKIGLLVYIQLNPRTFKGEEVARALDKMNWAALPGVAFADIICRVLVAYKKELLSEGIEITGTLDSWEFKGSGGGGGDASSDQVASSKLMNKIKGTKGFKKLSKIDKENISDEMIIDAIKGDLSRICIGIIKKYDKQKYKDAVETADSDTYKSEVTGWKGFIFSKNPTNVNARIKEKTIVSNRDRAVMNATSADVDAIAQAIVATVKDVKGVEDLNLESIHNSKLANLLFETSIIAEAANTSISAEDLKDALMASGALIYGASDLDPDSKTFKQAENYLIGTIAAFIKSNFGVATTDVDQFKALNLSQVAVEATVNREAPAGQAASKEVDNMAKGAGVPQDSNSKVNIDQLMNLLNKCGGDSMSAILMLLIENPGLLSQLLNLQKKGGSFGDAAKIISAESEELSDLDRQINVAIKQERLNLPKMSKTTLKKIFKVLSKKPLEKIPNVSSVKASIDVKDSQTLIAHLKEYFNVTEKEVDYDATSLEKLNSFLHKTYPYMKRKDYKKAFYFDDDNKFIGQYQMQYAIWLLAEKLLETDNVKSKDTRKVDLDYIQVGKAFNIKNYLSKVEGTDVIRVLKDEHDIIAVAGSGANSRKQEIDDAAELKKFSDKVVGSYNEVLKSMKSISLEESRFRRARVLKSKRQSSSIMSEAKFLEQEFRRLWNLK